jgi:hypothetical protein
VIRNWCVGGRGGPQDVAEQEIARIVEVVDRNVDALRRIREAGAVTMLKVWGYVGDGASVRLTAQQVRSLADASVAVLVTGSTADR